MYGRGRPKYPSLKDTPSPEQIGEYQIYLKSIDKRQKGYPIKERQESIQQARETISRFAASDLDDGTYLYIRHLSKGPSRSITDVEAYIIKNGFPELVFSRYKNVGTWEKDWPRTDRG